MFLPDAAREILIVMLDQGADPETPLILSRQDLANKANVSKATLDRHLMILRSLGMIDWQWLNRRRPRHFMITRYAVEQMRSYREYQRLSQPPKLD